MDELIEAGTEAAISFKTPVKEHGKIGVAGWVIICLLTVGGIVAIISKVYGRPKTKKL